MFRPFALGLAVLALPALALAIPPREKPQKKPNQPATANRAEAARVPSFGRDKPAGAPDRNPAARYNKPASLPASATGSLASALANRPGGGQRGGGERPKRDPSGGRGPSMLPDVAANIQPNQPTARPGQTDRQRPNPAPIKRPDRRPGGGDLTFDRPDFNRPEPSRPNRPDNSLPNRPDGNRPGTNRPDGNRPNRPRPSINRPVVVNRPDIDNVNIKKTDVTQNTVNVINQNNVGRNIANRYDRPYEASRRFDPNYRRRHYHNHDHHDGYDDHHHHHYGHHHYHDLHHHWRPTSAMPVYQPLYSNYYGGGAGYADNYSGSWLQVGSMPQFVNPFYTRPTQVTVQSYDYSQPIQVPQAGYQENRDELVRSEQAIRRFDDAREVFKRGEYGRASDLVDEAIKLLPNDPTLHQFRALVLFERERYSEAAAALYSVLAVDAGWEWETVAGLYDEPRRYEEQLRNLERYVAANPSSADARFLLGYHALVLGDLDSAAQNLQQVLQAKPDDRVTLNLLAAIVAQRRAELGG
jgi:tetratricopeptide (TPR) repeat protein